MNLSKENAIRALEGFNRIIESSPSLLSPFESSIQHITEFLKTAKRELTQLQEDAKNFREVREKYNERLADDVFLSWLAQYESRRKSRNA